MKSKWYRSKGMKFILIILAHIFVITATTGGLWVTAYPIFRQEIFEGKPAKKYEDSRNFNTQMKDYTTQVVNGISARKYFETEGKFDPNKIVDIEAYDQKKKYTGRNESGLAYRLKDLLKWNDTMNSTKDTNAENPIIVCRKKDGSYHYYRYSKFAALVNAKKLKLILNAGSETSTEEILSSLKAGNYDYDSENYVGGSEIRGIQGSNNELKYVDCWSYDGYSMEEPYAPVGADSLMNLANKDPRWNGRLNDAYNLVTSVVDSLSERYSEYQNTNEDIEEGDSNFYYIYADMKAGTIYTNQKRLENFQELDNNLKLLRKTGKYVIVKSKLKDFKTNLRSEIAEAWRDEIKNTGIQKKDFVFAACVNTNYPIADHFYSENQLYEKYGSGIRGICMLSVIAFALFVICVIWLTAIAGRRAEDEEMHLAGFDRWKTEIAAVLIIGLWVTAAVVGNFVYFDDYLQKTKGTFYSQADYVKNVIPYIIVGGIFGSYTCSMFLIGFLSFVRRIKAHIVWKNSLSRMFCHLVRDIAQNMYSLWRNIMLFVLFVVLHWIVMITDTYGFPLFMMLLAELAVFVYLVYDGIGRAKIKDGVKKIAAGELDYKVPTEGMFSSQKEVAEGINSVGAGLEVAVEASIKNERLKTNLITNVSHDIKTPLTSIINYVNLLKNENFDDPRIQRYIEVLEQKSMRLKTLTEDVVEASKITSGNIKLECMKLDFTELVLQTSAEYEEKFEERNLTEIQHLPKEKALVYIDGRRTWRILANLYNNAAKYAMTGSRIYTDLKVTEGAVIFSIKNISEQPLNINADQLTERFIRGDISRSTEGSGLGLSIAQTLTEMQKGKFELYLDGDLFKATVTFPKVQEEQSTQI